jgi:large subunit ribosomal protein L21
MYAVVKTGGKQYRVVENDVITVEKLVGEAGQAVELSDVLMLSGDQGVVLGDALKTAKVSAEIVRQARGPKIIIFKKRRRQNSRRKNGHRQDLTILKITGIHAA